MTQPTLEETYTYLRRRYRMIETPYKTFGDPIAILATVNNVNQVFYDPVIVYASGSFSIRADKRRPTIEEAQEQCRLMAD